MGLQKPDISGKFNRMTIICRDHEEERSILLRGKPARKMYRCQCDCGRVKTVAGSHLKNGEIKSCGCVRQERYYNWSVQRSTNAAEKRAAMGLPPLVRKPKKQVEKKPDAFDQALAAARQGNLELQAMLDSM